MEKVKLYREEQLPENAKKLYICRHASINGPCHESKFNARCTFPVCKHTENAQNAKACEKRLFRKEYGVLYVEVEQ